MFTLYGYRFDRDIRNERLAPGELDKPLFFQGDQVGCVVIHGIGGTPANVRVISDALIARGHTVLAPLLPGHGVTVLEQSRSTGAEWLQCALDSYDRLEQAGCKRIFALGLSLGGVLSGLIAEERKPEGLVMVCAPVVCQKFINTARRLSPLLPFAQSARENPCQGDPYANMYQTLSTRKLRDLDDLRKRLIRNMDRIACPTLAIRAMHDNKVDPRSYDILREKLPGEQLSYMEFADSPHGCTYGPERMEVAKACADYVENHLR